MKRLWKRLVNDQGFTLIELLAVVAILAILAGIGVPRVMSAIQNARAEAEEANLQLITSAVERYIIDEQAAGRSLEDAIDSLSEANVNGTGNYLIDQDQLDGYVSKWPMEGSSYVNYEIHVDFASGSVSHYCVKKQD